MPRQAEIHFSLIRFQGYFPADMESESSTRPGFFARLALAMRILFDAELAARALAPSRPAEAVRPAATPAAAPAAAKPVVLPPERQHASGLQVLAALQREGRLIDFLQQDVGTFSDEEIGAAARVVHAGCRKVLQQSVEVVPVLNESEGAAVTVPKGFDAQRIRLTGNVSGEPPYQGSLKHHGWLAKEVRLPAVQENLDPRVLAPAEVEL